MSVINVPGDSSLTINEAIKISKPGDTINVAPGLYDEQILMDVENITILGAKQDIDARTRIFVEKEESILSGSIYALAMNVSLNGFTIQKSNLTSKDLDVSGLKILNNIFQSNDNTIRISSIESSKEPSYLIQNNLFTNNSGQQIVFESNLSNVNILQNQFNNKESIGSINLTNTNTAIISNNVLNQDNSIIVSKSNNITFDGNIIFESLGELVIDNTTNIDIVNNIIISSSKNAINILNGNSNINIVGNCIKQNNQIGIVVNTEGTPNLNISISRNNIFDNKIGLYVNPESYKGTLDAELNYWGDSAGPNYNENGPGKGDLIIDSSKYVIFEPFLKEAINCPYPAELKESTTSIDVSPGNPIYFNIDLVISKRNIPLILTSFYNSLPPMNSGLAWNITSQTIEKFFNIVGPIGSQRLIINDDLPTRLLPGTYSVIIESGTNITDAGDIIINIITSNIQIGGETGLIQNLEAQAEGSLSLCIHSSSKIKLYNQEELEICLIKPGMRLFNPDHTISTVDQVIQCWSGVYDQIFTDCVIFEPNSLGQNIPSTRFAVDPGHPICNSNEYNKIGLQQAKNYVNNKDIYLVKWNEVENLLPGKNKRYDIVLSEESSNVYIANNIIVKSRTNRKVPGYSYE